MQNSFKRAMSFVLALIMLMALSTSFAMAQTGTRPRDEFDNGIKSIDSITWDAENWYVRVTGVVDLYGNPEDDDAVKNELSGVLCLATGERVGTFVRSADTDQDGNFQGYFTFSDDRLTSSGIEGDSSLVLQDGEYYIAFLNSGWNGNLAFQDHAPKGYRVDFAVNNGIIDDWTDIHGDYELSISPSSIELPSTIWNTTATSVDVTVANTGFEDITDVDATVVADPSGSAIDGVLSIENWTNGEDLLEDGSSSLMLSASALAKPGTYTAILKLEGKNATGGAVTTAAPITYFLDREAQATPTGITGAAATTVGGLGKLGGLTPNTTYEAIVDTIGDEAFGEDFDFENAVIIVISAADNAAGVVDITPGAYKVRLPGDDYRKPSDWSSSADVLPYYNFNSATLGAIRYQTDVVFDLTKYVDGGAGNKEYRMISGNLPAGLEVTTYGAVTGAAMTDVTSTAFTFTVEVTDDKEAIPTRQAVFVITEILQKVKDVTGPALTFTDTTATITNFKTAQRYAITTSALAPTTTPSVADFIWSNTSFAGIFKDLDRHTEYTIYTYTPPTADELATGNWTSSAILYTTGSTLYTTVTAVKISGAGLDGETVTAVPTPTFAAVTYEWLVDGEKVDSATGPSFTITSDMADKKIVVVVNGIEEDGYIGIATSSALLVGGGNLVIKVDSWNSNLPVKAELRAVNASGDAITYEAITTAVKGTGEVVDTITFSSIEANDHYQLILTKDGHTSTVVSGVAVEGGKTLDLSKSSDSALQVLKLYPGDFNGDNSIRLEDRQLLMQNKYYGTAVPGSVVKEGGVTLIDVDGDGFISWVDVAIMMTNFTYGQDGLVLTYTK